MDGQMYEYDVALSFAGVDREIAITIARIAETNGLKVFIDEQHLWEAWGKNLNDYLSDIYYNKSRYCLILISKEYCEKAYTNLERKIALDRVLESKQEYVLPVRIDDSWPAGLPRATAYLDLREISVEKATTILLQKIKGPGAVIDVSNNAAEQKLVLLPAKAAAEIKKKPTIDDKIVSFAAIQMRPESKNWMPVPVTDDMAEPELSWRTGLYDDPVLDITIMNSADRPLLVTAVGVEVIRIRYEKMKIMGGAFARTVPFHLTYKLPLPDLWDTLADQLREKGLQRNEAVDVQELVFCRLPDPVMIEPFRPYRFGLHLFGYVNFFPNDISLSFWVKTNAGEARSAVAQLRFEIGSEIPPLSRFLRLTDGASQVALQQNNAMMYLKDKKDERIRDLAYQLWEKAGRPEGQDAALWNKAEKELPMQLLAEKDLYPVKKRPL